MDDSPHQPSISSEAALARIAQSLSLVAFFTDVWAQNPQLAKQAGRKVEEFMLPLAEAQRRHAQDLDPNR